MVHYDITPLRAICTAFHVCVGAKNLRLSNSKVEALIVWLRVTDADIYPALRRAPLLIPLLLPVCVIQWLYICIYHSFVSKIKCAPRREESCFQIASTFSEKSWSPTTDVSLCLMTEASLRRTRTTDCEGPQQIIKWINMKR